MAGPREARDPAIQNRKHGARNLDARVKTAHEGLPFGLR
jgi:hypothetical protein